VLSETDMVLEETATYFKRPNTIDRIYKIYKVEEKRSTILSFDLVGRVYFSLLRPLVTITASGAPRLEMCCSW
jgi:hypothetical protein